MGGGEHLKPAIEDLLQFLPDGGGSGGGGGKVTLITCLGLCNRAPNMVLKSRCSADYTQQLANNGLVVNASIMETRDERSREKPLRSVTLSEITIYKLARSLGFKTEHHIRAIACKHAGIACLERGQYEDALQHFATGLSASAAPRDADKDGCYQAEVQLQVSLHLCCAKARVQWATEVTELSKEVRREVLQQAATGAFKLLSASASSTGTSTSTTSTSTSTSTSTAKCAGDNSSSSTTTTSTSSTSSSTSTTVVAVEESINVDSIQLELTKLGAEPIGRVVDIHVLVAQLVCSGAGAETQKMQGSDGGRELAQEEGAGAQEEGAGAQEQGNGKAVSPPQSIVAGRLAADAKTLAQCCVVLADAWNGLASGGGSSDSESYGSTAGVNTDEQRKLLTDGALLVYRGVITAAAAYKTTCKVRLLRAKERRRLEKAVAALESAL
jgi:hypothetical protein